MYFNTLVELNDYWLLSLSFILCTVFVWTIVSQWTLKKKKNPIIAVIVFGDLGRSPRMQHHALSLTQLKYNDESYWKVWFIGYGTTRCNTNVEYHPSITLYRFQPPVVENIRFCLLIIPIIGPIVFSVFKLLDQSIRLIICLFKCPPISLIIIQNPPSLPAIPIIWICSYVLQYKFIIDWHNYGSSILSLSPSFTYLTSFYKTLEFFFGTKSNGGFCVSQSMKMDLLQKLNKLSHPSFITVLYDKPALYFRPISIYERFMILQSYFPNTEFQPGIYSDLQSHQIESLIALNEDNQHSNLFYKTHLKNSFISTPYIEFEIKVPFDYPTMNLFIQLDIKSSRCTLKQRPNRPVLIISSTSWTPDEDFTMLLEALQYYNYQACHFPNIALPNIVMFITGRGVMKNAWLKKASLYPFQHVCIYTGFVPYDDYWRLLAASDLGICLHTSSSGLDLPMKAVDMQGVGLPIFAYNYPTLSSELIKHEENGIVFQDGTELGKQLCNYLKEFPQSHTLLNTLHQYAETCRPETWDHMWNHIAKPTISTILSSTNTII